MRLGPMSQPAALIDPVVTSYDLDRFCQHVTRLLGREVKATIGAPGEVRLRVDGSWWYVDAVAEMLGDLAAVGLRIDATRMERGGGPYR